MIRPQLRAFMCGSAARMAWNAAERLIAMTASHFSTGNSSTGATCWMPALFTRMSTPPELARRLRHHRRDLGGLRHVGGAVVDLHLVLRPELGDELVDLRRVAEAVQHHVQRRRRRARARCQGRCRSSSLSPARLCPRGSPFHWRFVMFGIVASGIPRVVSEMSAFGRHLVDVAVPRTTSAGALPLIAINKRSRGTPPHLTSNAVPKRCVAGIRSVDNFRAAEHPRMAAQAGAATSSPPRNPQRSRNRAARRSAPGWWRSGGRRREMPARAGSSR